MPKVSQPRIPPGIGVPLGRRPSPLNRPLPGPLTIPVLRVGELEEQQRDAAAQSAGSRDSRTPSSGSDPSTPSSPPQSTQSMHTDPPFSQHAQPVLDPQTAEQSEPVPSGHSSLHQHAGADTTPSRGTEAYAGRGGAPAPQSGISGLQTPPPRIFNQPQSWNSNQSQGHTASDPASVPEPPSVSTYPSGTLLTSQYLPRWGSGLPENFPPYIMLEHSPATSDLHNASYHQPPLRVPPSYQRQNLNPYSQAYAPFQSPQQQQQPQPQQQQHFQQGLQRPQQQQQQQPQQQQQQPQQQQQQQQQQSYGPMQQPQQQQHFHQPQPQPTPQHGAPPL
ncbi:hypothetical protein HYPSUDRAFT_208652, partial [Hypholoma sublateritium FD-334 SS-4]